MPEPIVVGVDIAKKTFDAAIGSAGPVHSFSNDDLGHVALLTTLANQSVNLIVRRQSVVGKEFGMCFTSRRILRYRD